MTLSDLNVKRDVERRFDHIEKRLLTLEENQVMLKSTDDRQWDNIDELKKRFDEQKIEMKIRMDTISQEIGALRSETAARSGEVSGALNILSQQNDNLIELVKSNTESSAGIVREHAQNKRHWWQGLFTVIGVVVTSAAGVITALGALVKYLGW